jgi:hypothetical protein
MMTSAPGADHRSSLTLIEGGLTAIAIALAFCSPRFASPVFCRIEHAFRGLARRRGWAVFSVGVANLLLRLALLPLIPAPKPFVPDDFSFLLAARTFAAGRLTNGTPAMWVHFESIHISMKPTYASMYFPGQGLLLAAGQLLFRHPWSGVLISSALMSAAICWMLQAWLPSGWALLGGGIAVLRLGLFSYWINTFSGGGCLAALGGALVLGSFPRIIRAPRGRECLLMAAGISLLLLTRPYEGVLLCLPVCVFLVRQIVLRRKQINLRTGLRLAAAPLLLVIAAGAWMGYYDYRAFGSPLTPPYKVNRTTYAMAPYYVWQSARPEPAYRHAVLKTFYHYNELEAFAKIHSWHGFVPQTLIKALRGVLFFTGIALLPPLLMSRRVFHDRRTHFLLICVAVLAAGMVIEIFLIPHYLAPFTVAFYALGLQAMRHLRVWRFEGRQVGLAMVRLLVTVCILMGGIRICAAPLDIQINQWPASFWTDRWYGPGDFGNARAQIQAKLQQMPGNQLAIVRYGMDHNALDEWVYNEPDIDASKVIWARGMSEDEDLELIHYYKGRQVWLVKPDLATPAISPYPLRSEAMSAGN